MKTDWNELGVILTFVFVVPFIFFAILVCFIMVGDQVTSGLTSRPPTETTNDVVMAFTPAFLIISLGITLTIYAISKIGERIKS